MVFFVWHFFQMVTAKFQPTITTTTTTQKARPPLLYGKVVLLLNLANVYLSPSPSSFFLRLKPNSLKNANPNAAKPVTGATGDVVSSV